MADTFRDNVKVTITGTPGTGAITWSAAVTDASNGDYLDPDAAGAVTGESHALFLQEGNHTSIETGCVYTTSTKTWARGTVLVSSTGSRLSLTIAAKVSIVAASASLSALAPLASPTFTGTPAAPTPTTSDNSTNIATTAFVKAQGYGALPSLSGKSAGSALVADGSGSDLWQPIDGSFSGFETEYHWPDTVNQDTANPTVTLTTGTIYLLPFSVPGNFGGLAFKITTAAAAGVKARVGFYGSNADGTPGTLIKEFTTATQIDCTSTGEQLGVGATQKLTGRVWLAIAVSGNVTVRKGKASERALRIGGNSSIDAAPITSMQQSTTYGALPSTITAAVAGFDLPALVVI